MQKESITKVFRKALILYIILPVSILESLLFLILVNIQINIVRDKVVSVQQQIVSNVENELREAKLLLATIAHNEYLIQTVSDYSLEQKRDKKLQLIFEIEGNLDNLSNYNDKIDSISFFFKHEGEMFFYTPLVDAEVIRKEKWYQDAQTHKGDVIIIEELTPLSRERSSIPRINLVIAPPQHTGFSSVEAIILSMNSDSLYSLKRRTEGREESYALLNHQGDVLFFDSEKSDFSQTRAKNIYPIKRSPWVFETSFSYLGKIFNALKMFTLVFCLIMICIFLFFLVFTQRLAFSILEPISKLSHRMGQIGLWQQSCDQNIIINEAYQLEIQQIYDSFFQMNRRLVNLNQETLKLELEALQFQINPHFLINTLNSIKILAQVRGNEEVVKMTKELMVIVNGLLHRTGMFTTLENELDCVTGYIHIQKIRFGDLFDYSIQVPDNLKELVIMKMIMQPIIENAIQHGFRKSDQRGHLFISASSEINQLLIRIQDDSGQADLSKIERILDSALENSITEEIDQHKGLRNIQRRIFLRYGRPWGVSVSLDEGLTTFTLRLPLPQIIGCLE